MRASLLLILSLTPLFAAGNVCTLTASVNLSASAGHWTGSGCTGTGYTPNLDGIVPGSYTLTVDQNVTFGNYQGPYMSYVSGTNIPVTDTTDTTCSAPTAVFVCLTASGCKQQSGSGYYLARTGITAKANGTVVTSAAMNNAGGPSGSNGGVSGGGYSSSPVRMWLEGDSAAPTVTAGGTGCTGAVYSPYWVQGSITSGTASPPVTAINWTSSSGNIVINTGVTLTVAGWGVCGATSSALSCKITMKRGSAINIDNSLATPNADGSYPIYALFSPQIATGAGATFVLDTSDCILAQPCLINGNPTGTGTNNLLVATGNNANVIDFGISSGTSCSGCVVQMSNLGGNLDYAIGVMPQYGPANYFWTNIGSMIKNSGPIYFTLGATAVMNYSLFHSNSAGWTDFNIWSSATKTTGIRQVVNTVFDISVGDGGANAGCNGGGTVTGVTLADSWFGGVPCYVPWSSINGVIFAPQSNGPGGTIWQASTTNNGGALNTIYNYFYSFSRQPINNWHVRGDWNQAGATDNFNIFDQSDDSTNDMSPHGIVPPSSGLVHYTANSELLLPSRQGHGNGWIAGEDTGQANTHTELDVYHTTVWGRNQNTKAIVFADHSPGGAVAPMVMKSDLMVGLGGANATYKAQSLCATPLETDAFGTTGSNADYNALYNGTASMSSPCNPANQKNGYAFNFTSTGSGLLGAHDIDVVNGGTGTAAANAATNPMFVDSARNLVLWDTKYLGTLPTDGPWAVGLGYAAGHTVSDAHPNVYCPNSATSCASGATINYRSLGISSGTNTGVTEPGLDLTQANGHITSCSASGNTLTIDTDTAHGLTAGVSTVVATFFPYGNVDVAPVKTVSAVNSATEFQITTSSSGLIPANCASGTVISEWRNWWQYNSEISLQNAIAAGTTYTDGAIGCVSCTAPQALVNWVIRGFTVQNQNLRLAGHDGCDIGADGICTTLVTIPPVMVVQ